MKAGDIVQIYSDPLTEKSPEGKARLVRYEGSLGQWQGRKIESWAVEFETDPGAGVRAATA
jgi:hypothetical protein